MATLRPRARIIRTIGDQLISGPEAALIELVKNAYDADSPFALIKIAPQNGDTGIISLADEGHGMSEQDVIEKWFEPVLGRNGFSCWRLLVSCASPTLLSFARIAQRRGGQTAIHGRRRNAEGSCHRRLCRRLCR